MTSATSKKLSVDFRSTVFLIIPFIFLFFYEFIFRLVTGCSFSFHSQLYVLLFTIVPSAALYLIFTAVKNTVYRHIASSVILFLLSLTYLIEYFIFRQFKIFYDINTVFAGGKGVLSSFRGEIYDLVFSTEGIIVIAIFFVPVIVYAAIGWMIPLGEPVRWRERVAAAGIGVLAFLIGWLCVLLHPIYSLQYTDEYNFQYAVDHFGLSTAIRLDIENMITPKVDDSFIILPSDPTPPIQNTGKLPTNTDTPETGSGKDPLPSETDNEAYESDSPSQEDPVVYTPNILELDLDTLISTSSGKINEIHRYIASLSPTYKNEYTGLFEGKNLIFITAEAFTAECIDPTLTPTLYRLATKGMNFTDYYQPASAGTTGGEYQNIFGLLPSYGGGSFNATVNRENATTIFYQLGKLGYYGQAFHNNSYTYYNRNKTHANLGFSSGFMGYGNGMEEFVTHQWPQSDLEMIEGTLPMYIDEPQFCVYYMTVSGHGNYGRTSNSMTLKNWDRVAHLDVSDPVKGYFAANLELEDAVSALVRALEEKGIADDTVICISSDHFPYALDTDTSLGQMEYLAELYGCNISNSLVRDHNRLILWCGSLEDQDPITVSSPTSSLDVLPTLLNLFGIPYDSRLYIGRDVFSGSEAIVFNTSYDWKTDLGTYLSSTGKFTPANDKVVIPDGYVARIKAIVKNKVNFSRAVLDYDYYKAVLPASAYR
ncbi:MAG: hypothetical protein E7628_07745 [Ruminococcaceae bacterium]|nr:hypothetical protein [Oscillospiraceae bacterium]